MKINFKNRTVRILFALAVALESASLVFDFSFAQVVNTAGVISTPRKLDVSAIILNNENKVIANGDYDVRFALYSADRTDGSQAEGTPLWTETQKVTVYNGILHAFPGTVTPIPTTINFSSGEFYVGIKMGTDSEMTPRKRIGAVPLAMDALSVNGATVGTGSGNLVQLGTNGKINIGQLPIGTSGNNLVTYNNIPTGKITVSGQKYITASGMKLTLKQIDLATNTTGLLSVANGGTGLSAAPTNGQLLIGNGSGYTLSGLTEGEGIDVTNGAGSIAISAEDATNANKGIASFNATNFSVLAGAVNTIQNIDATAIPVFAGLTLNGNLSLGANTLTTSNTGLVANLNADLLDGHEGSYYAAGGSISGTENFLAKFGVGGNSIGNSLIYDNGTSVGIGTTNPAGVFHIGIGNTSPIFVASGGNVGIWTTAPSQRLEVAGVALFDNAVNLGSTGKLTWDGGKTNTFNILAVGSKNLSFGTNNAYDLMFIDTSGNVGIGTTNLSDPGGGFGAASGVAKLYVSDKTAGNFTKILIDSPANTGSAIQFLGAGASKADIGYSNNFGTNILSMTNRVSGGNIILTTTGTGNVLISNGNVGIGTTNPGYSLDVTGNLRVGSTANAGLVVGDGSTGYLQVGGATLSKISGNALSVNGGFSAAGTVYSTNNQAGLYTQFQLTNTTSAANNTGSMMDFLERISGQSTGGTVIARMGGVITDINASAYKGALVFYTANNAAPNEKMRIDYLGNVGIGTTNPNAKLKSFSTSGVNGHFYTLNGNSGDWGLVAVQGEPYEISPSSTGALFIDSFGGYGIYEASDGGKNALMSPTAIGANNSGSAKLYINGNVGIGTTNPGLYDLNVNGSIFATDYYSSDGSQGATSTVSGLVFKNGLYVSGSITSTLLLPSGTTGQTLWNNAGTWTATSNLYNNGTNVGIGTTNPLGLFSVGSSSLFQVNSSGFIGLGGTTPLFSIGVDSTDSNKFKIYAGSDLTGSSQFTIDSNGVTSIANLQMGEMAFDDNAGAVSWVDMGVTSAAPVGTVESYTAQMNGNPMITVYGLSDAAGGVTNLGVGIGNTAPLAFLDVAGTAWLRGGTSPAGLYVNSSGYVGIGTTSPGDMLNVKGGNIQVAAAASSVNAQLTYNTLSFNGGNGFINANTTNSLLFTIANQEKMKIDGTTGYVGIGTTNPTTALDVNGYINFNSSTGGISSGGNTILYGSNNKVFLGSGTYWTTLNYGSTATTSHIFQYGNVGIGTTSPKTSLHVSGGVAVSMPTLGSAASGNSYFTNTDNSYGLLIGSSGTGRQWLQAQRTDGTATAYDLLLNPAGGNVGIGTTNPGYKLDVNGTLGVGSTAYFSSNVGIGVTNPTNALQVSGNVYATTVQTPQIFYSSTSNLIVSGGLSNPGGEIDLIGGSASTNPGIIQFRTGTGAGQQSEKMRLDTNGNVGIGTTNPQATFDVGGNFYISSAGSITRITGTSNSNLTSSGLALATTSTARIRNVNTGSGTSLALIGSGSTDGYLVLQSTEGNGSSDYIKMAVGNNGATEALRIINNGNIGIGTTNPGYLLTLNGSQSSYLGYIYNSNTAPTAAGLYVRADGTGNLLTLNSGGSDILTVSAAQTTINNPVNFASVGDVGMANNLILTNTGSAMIKFKGPGYVMTDSSWGNLDLTLSASNSGEVIIDDNIQITGSRLNVNGVTGYVGIGTTSPAYNLDVAGGIVSAGSYNLNTITALSTASSNTMLRGATGLGIAFNVNGTSTLATSSMYLNSSGYLGIGTTNPGRTLSIVGNMAVGTDASTGSISLGIGGGASLEYKNGNRFGFTLWDTDNYYERMTVLKGGNVGIGWSSPASKLTISGGLAVGTTSPSSIYLTTLAPDGGAIFEGKVGIGTTNPAGVFHIGIGNTSPIFVASGGNIGIWTTAPSQRLEVAGVALFDNAVNLGSTGKLTWDGGKTNTFNILAVGSKNLSFGTNNAYDLMFIDTSGNVGIGTTNPATFKLQVAGSVGPQTNDTYDLGSDALRWQSAYIGPGTVHIGTSTSDEYTISYDTTNNRLGFNVNGSGNPEIVMDSSGSVGIGTTNPVGGMLHVQGGVSTPIGVTFSGSSGVNADWNTGFPAQSINTSIFASDAIVSNVGVYNASDRRLKEDIATIDSSLGTEFLDAVNPVHFKWKKDGSVDSGFIAQDLITSGFGYLVSAVPDETMQAETENGLESPAGAHFIVKYDSIIPILAVAAKEQRGEILDIKNEMQQMSGDMEESTGRISDIQAQLADSNITTTDKINLVGTSLSNVSAETQNLASLQAGQETRIKTLEDQMALLSEKTQAVLDLADALKADKVIYRDELGNVDLLGGKLVADGVVAGAFTVQVTDETKRTVGTEAIHIYMDENLDGIDDNYPGNDGKSATVLTKAVSAASKIFVTPQGDAGGSVWTEKKMDASGAYTGFVIHVSAPVTKDVKVDWFIVEEK